MTNTKSLLLLDGLAMAYRGFYAIPELTTKDGRHTNALMGFIRMLLQLKSAWKPTHWAAAFDGGRPAERMAVLETYKAQRAPMPDALKEQIPYIDEYLEAAQVSSFRLELQEADDVMATLAVRAEGEGASVYMATSDKDMYQIVNERICVVSPAKDMICMRPKDVAAKTGVRPDQMVDYQALMGDAVDNIDGVPGVGAKTAARWLNEYGSLDEIFNHAKDIHPPRFRELLVKHEPTVRRNRGLMKLRTDLDVPLSWEALAVREGDSTRLLSFFSKYELSSLSRMVQGELGL